MGGTPRRNTPLIPFYDPSRPTRKGPRRPANDQKSHPPVTQRDLNARLKGLVRNLGFERDWYLIIIGAGIGTFTAFSALGFAWLLHEVEKLTSRTRADLPLWALPAIPMVGALTRPRWFRCF